MKKLNKILALLIALVMVISLLPTAALATVTGESAGSVSVNRTGDDCSVSEDTSAEAGGSGVTITEISNPGVDLRNDSQSAEKLEISPYAEDEVVRVIVVLKDEPLLDRGFTVDQIAANVGAVANASYQIEAKQDTIVNQISKVVRGLGIQGVNAEVTAKYRYSIAVNGIAVEVPYGALDGIRALDGVETAFVAPQYSLPEDVKSGGDTLQPYTSSTSQNFGSAQTWETAGYTGEGMRIAIIDTGIDTDHPSFVGAPPLTATSLAKEEISSVLESLNAYQLYRGLTADKLYVSEKIPYAFNYVDQDLDVTHDNDYAGDHGSHVAGIAAANKLDTTTVVGVAPEAQLIIMKVFGKNGGAYFDDVLAALEDCFRLNVDAVNLSLGSPAGFSDPEGDEAVEACFEKIKETDIIVSVAAGNSHSAPYGSPIGQEVFGFFANFTTDPDNGIVSSPATYTGATSVASWENDRYMSNYIVLGDAKIVYYDATYEFAATMASGDASEYTYVMIPGLGAAEDFEGIDVTGKIAVIQRGTIAFTDKQENAAAAGAVACIVYDNVDSDEPVYMQDSGALPNVFISKASGEALAAAADPETGEGTLTIMPADDMISVASPTAGEMSDFSSWGVTPDLRLVPDVSAPGGNIYSCYTDGQYGMMDGTSMAAPHITGMSALVLQYLRDTYGLDEAQTHTVAEALIMSTAVPVTEFEYGGVNVPYSPRKQGAGLANVYSAVISPAYLTVDGGKPSVSMGDGETGVYSFSFEVNNLSDEALTYTLDSNVLTDWVNDLYEDYGYLFMGESSLPLDVFDADTAVTFTGATVAGDVVTVPANGTAVVNVSISLGAWSKAYMSSYYPNGIYVDGFIRLLAEDEDAVDLSLPFMGFYGDWSAAKVFDSTWYYEEDEVPERYWNVLFTNFGSSGFNLGLNPYLAEDYDPAHNVLSPNGDGYQDYINDIYLAMMRNAKAIDFTWLKGNDTLYSSTVDYVRKSYYMSVYGVMLPFIYSWYLDDIYDYSDTEDGDALILRIDAYLDDGDEDVDETLEIPIFIDNEEPELLGYELIYDAVADTRTLRLTVSDNYDIAAVIPLTMAGDPIEYIAVNTKTADDEGETAVIDIDVSSYDSSFNIVICDYGCNESYYGVTFEGEVNANVNSFYGYRRYSAVPVVYNGELYIVPTEDYNGWYSFSEPDTMLMHTDAYFSGETFVAAAEYIDGYVIGVDVEGTIFANKAGDWSNRTVIGTLELDGEIYPALDMAFDYTTNTLYILTDELSTGAGGHLVKMDYLTGELTDLGKIRFGSNRYSQGITLACDNQGVLYTVDYSEWAANGYESGALYTIEVEYDGALDYDADQNGKFDMNDVQYLLDYVNGLSGKTLADADAFDLNYDGELNTADVQLLKEILDSGDYGAATITTTKVGDTGYQPESFQSMTVDHATNKLYWAAYESYTAYNALYEVDKTTGELTEVGAMEYNSEMTGLFKPFKPLRPLYPTEAVELENLVLSEDSLILAAGSQQQLAGRPVPYYAEITGNIIWSSDNEDVATVDEDGLVTAVGAGTATITAELDGITATCAVRVVEIDADLYVYDAGDAYLWLNFNANAPESAEYVNGVQPYGTYDAFVSAAYTVDGIVYAYDSAGGFYRIDAETLEGVRLGTNSSVNGSSGYMVAMTFSPADGHLYGIAQIGNYFEGYIYSLVRINPSNGDFVAVGDLSEYMTMNLAVAPDGTFYSVTDLFDYDTYEVSTVVLSFTLDGDEISNVETVSLQGFEPGSGNYNSLVYSSENGGLFWADYYGRLLWIDPADGTNIALGEIGETAYYYPMNVCLFEVPADDPDVNFADPASVTMPESFMILEGGSTSANVVLAPWNARAELTYRVEDEDIALVDENGTITGVAAGTTTLTVSCEGFGDLTATITVVPSAGELYGFLITDFLYSSSLWLEIPDVDPTLAEATYDGYDDDFTPFSGAYYDGYVYAYCQDQWGMNNYKYFLVKYDATSYYNYTVIGQVHETIRDMDFDYTTGIMYAVVEDGVVAGALAQVNLKTAEVFIIGDTGHKLAAMTVDGEGNIFAIGEDANLYRIDKNTAEATLIGPTGVISANLFQSMHYDVTTGNTYWAQVARDYSNGLYLVDLSTGSATSLGTVGTGAEVAALYTIPETEPQVPGTVDASGVSLTEKTTVAVGERVTLQKSVLPFSVAAVLGDVSWSSSDETVATVDNGVVTGVAAGTAVITASVNGVTAECTVTVTAEARRFYAYDEINAQWISFTDGTDVEVERVDDEGEDPIMASVYVDGQLYSFTVDGSFYSVDPETFERTYVGEGVSDMLVEVTIYDWWGDNYTLEEPVTPYDMSYDEATGKAYGLFMVEDYENWAFVAVIGEVDLATGEVTVVLVSDEIQPGNLLVKNGRAYFVDTYFTGMLTYVDLYADEPTPVQHALVYNYWGDFTGGRSFIEDPLTGTIYVLRDNLGEETSLWTMSLGDADVTALTDVIGDGSILNSLFVR